VLHSSQTITWAGLFGGRTLRSNWRPDNRKSPVLDFSGYRTYQDLLLSDNDCGISFACLLLAVRSVVENVRAPLGLLEREPVQNES